uniref:Uncharacterized protein n=1 Tax=Oryza brachyantha TaxID=4533 RepID=J3LAV3_ORYBR
MGDVEDGTTRLWWSLPPADPLDVDGEAAAITFSKCLSSMLLSHFNFFNGKIGLADCSTARTPGYIDATPRVAKSFRSAVRRREISARRFIDDGIDRVIYDEQRLHQPGITTVVTSYTTYGGQPKIGDPTSATFSDICKMTQGHPLTYAKTLPMVSPDICKVPHL